MTSSRETAPLSTPLSTRGAEKLKAALAMFDVAHRVRGRAAIDVGASTGGFTAVLLDAGATRVTAMEVGHGQLAPSLRGDARVELHEKTDFRRVSLDIASGPFGFFTVDVSFVAARNMLRSLAFRLEPGAHGIVLLKPQFELSAAELRSGEGVDEPRLRERARVLLCERAERSGFRVLDVRDSTVPGESGTVEMFVLLAFEGRPEAFPKPGEKRAHAQPEPSPRARGRGSRVAPDAQAQYEWFAIAAPGVEALLAVELQALSAVCRIADVRELAGGVAFRGPLLAGYAANLGSRLATRVVLRLGSERAREFSLLRRKVHAFPFERFIAPGSAVRIDVTTRHCRLYHTKAIAETVELAIADRLRAPVVRAGSPNDEGDDDEASGPEVFSRVLVRGVDDVFTVSIDSSGELLHRRGGREEQGAAPMRETLACAVLAHAGYRGEEPLIDAMCGSGTLAIEAAQIAAGRLPGERRAFALERFAGVSKDVLDAEKVRLTAALAREASPPIVAFDRDRKMVEVARRNAERIGVLERIAFQQADVREAEPPFEAGLVVCNPPYGKRLGASGEVKLLYRAIGHALRGRFGKFRVAIIVPRGTPEAVLGLRIEQRVALQNGGVHVTLIIGTPEP
jgi:putative N6-adenine-specific DNA methylase